MVAAAAVAAILAACTYDLHELQGHGGDAAAGSGGSNGDAGPEGTDSRATDAVDGPGGGGGGTAAAGTGAGGVAGAGGGGGSGGRQNGAGCIGDGECSSGHCVRAMPTDASGLCCDDVPGKCQMCSGGFVVPVNDNTMVDCVVCQGGRATPHDGPTTSADGGTELCLDGTQYVEPSSGSCARKGWTISASVVCTAGACLAEAPSMYQPPGAIDGDFSTRYTSGIAQGSQGPEAVTISFPGTVTASGVWLYTIGDDGPAAYLVEISTDGTTFEGLTPPATGPGAGNLTVMFATPVKMKALRVTQTGTKPLSWWSINEMNVLDCISN